MLPGTGTDLEHLPVVAKFPAQYFENGRRVALRYPNGVASDVVVENALGVRLLAHCGAERLEDLVGEPWSRLVEILAPV